MTRVDVTPLPWIACSKNVRAAAAVRRSRREPAHAPLDIGFINPPATVDRSTIHSCCSNEAGREGAHPVVDRAWVHGDPALGQPFGDICVTETIAELPPDGERDDVVREAIATEGRCGSWCHPPSTRSAPVQLALRAISSGPRKLLPGPLRTLHLTLHSRMVEPQCTTPLHNPTKPMGAAHALASDAKQEEFLEPSRTHEEAVLFRNCTQGCCKVRSG